MSGKKKFSFVSVILSVICVVFVCEAAAPAAAIGNQQFFWWIFLIITFLLPYGMVVAELGTTYDSEGGIYDWVRDALGDKWGARISWYYWINFPLWIASLATLFPPILGMIFGADIEANIWLTLGIEIAFVWIVVFMSFSKVSDSEWILNGGAILKVLVAVSVGVLGIWFACTNGFAGSMAPETFLPDVTNTAALGYLSIIIFNFMGFEVVCTFAKDMQNPARDIPKAIILGGLAIGAIYLFCGFGIGAAVVNGIVAAAVLLIQLIPNEAISNGLFWTLFATSVVFLIMGEVVRIVSARGRKEEFKGLTPAMAAERLAAEVEGEPDQLEPADPAQIEAILAADGFSTPAEFAPQDRVWMGWPHRTDTWAHGAKPAQRQYAAIARAISQFTPVTMCANEAYDTLAAATDAKGRQLKVYKLLMPVKPLYMDQASCDTIDVDENAEPRVADEPLIASYMNYLVTNGGLIVPQYGDENDALAVQTLQEIYDEVWGEGAYTCVGVQSEQVVFGGGNIHCITQQEPTA